MFKRVVFVFFVLALKFIVFADIKIVQDVLIEEIDLKTGIKTIKKSKQIKWLGKNIIINKNKNFVSFINLDKKNHKSYFVFIDNKNKTFFKTGFPLNFSKLLPKELLAVRVNRTPRIKLKDLKIKEKIGKYNCNTYSMTLNFLMMTVKIKVWASELKKIKNLSLIDKKQLNMLNTNSLLSYYYPNLPNFTKKNKREFYYILNKIKGVWIKSETYLDLLVRKYKKTMKIKNIYNEAIPPNILNIPKNYKEITNLKF